MWMDASGRLVASQGDRDGASAAQLANTVFEWIREYPGKSTAQVCKVAASEREASSRSWAS